MADNLEETLGEAELVEGLEKKKFNGKTVVFIAAGAIVALLLVVGISSLLGGEEALITDDPEIERLAQEASQRRDEIQLEQDRSNEDLELLFVELDEQRFNLNTGGQGSSFLSAKIVLEVDRESYRSDLQSKMPRILDEFNTYMRELRPEDLDGSAGIFRLKEELLMRINQAVAPTRVKDVLFQQFLVQG